MIKPGSKVQEILTNQEPRDTPEVLFFLAQRLRRFNQGTQRCFN